MACSVCLEETNKSTRAPSNCQYCNTIICRTCIQTYLLNDISDTPQCVNPTCGRGWPREWLDSQLTRTFRLNTYKEHREKILADREKARLPETQEQAAFYKAAQTAAQTLDVEWKELNTQLQALQRKINICDRERYNTKRTLDTFGTVAYPPVRNTEAKEKRTIAEFIKPCPADGCKGFLSTAWKCGLCEQWSCPDCHDLKGPNKDVEHTCDPAKVETARLIQRETKGCPKCGVRISKIDGCDQMWCTACNTAFNWRTNVIANGPVHNPHYFDWLRQQGLQPQANPIHNCEQIDDRAIMRLLEDRGPRPRYYPPPGYVEPILPRHQQTNRYLFEAYRIRNEYADATMRRNQDAEETFRQLRVRYMIGELSEEEWKTALQRTEKNTLFQRAKNDIGDLYANVARDILRGLLAENAVRETIRTQIEQLVEYVNEAYQAVSKRFGRTIQPLKV